MEPVHGELKASKCAAEDFISNMPDNVVTKILNHLPLRDAASTGILSRKWRFKWTLITKLVFDDDLYGNLRGWGGEPSFNGKDLSRLIIQLKGPITKFDLDIPGYILFDIDFDDEDVNHWLSVLSRKGIKKLNITCLYDPFVLPTQLFSCLELKHLFLHNCFLHRPPSFCGFPKLLTLLLSSPRFERYTIGELIARCPLLEVLRYDEDDEESVDDLEVAEITKHGNLKMLDLSLHVLESITLSGIFHLTDLPKLEELHLSFHFCKFLAEDGVGKVATTSLSLKTLDLSGVDFDNDIMVSFISEMICSSPNLHNLNIWAIYGRNVSPGVDSDCNTMGMLQLRSVEFSCYEGSENEVRFIKSLFACSPLLEKIKIHGRSSKHYSPQVFSSDKGKLMFATKLLKLPRASPIAEVDIYWD